MPGLPSAPIGQALMDIASQPPFVLSQRHLLGIEGLSRDDINGLLDRAEHFVDYNRQINKKQSTLRGRTQINLFFEVSTRTQSSFELAGKRLGADVMNMSTSSSSMRPLLRRMVSASSRACVGCSCAPSPALITEQSTLRASSSTAPEA